MLQAEVNRLCGRGSSEKFRSERRAAVVGFIWFWEGDLNRECVYALFVSLFGGPRQNIVE